MACDTILLRLYANLARESEREREREKESREIDRGT